MIPKKLITNAALTVGFDLVGVVPVEPLVRERNRFEEWLLAGNHSSLSYLERNREKRFDASLLVEGSRSIVVCAVSYLSPFSRGYSEGASAKVASYALARDYHLTIKEMLAELAERLKVVAPDLKYRAFTDSAPVAEKTLAVRAGLGWIGRQSLVVNPKFGTMVLLGELIINEVVDEYSEPMRDVGCGSCRACVDNCPNSAILDNRLIDTRRCISCRTIEREWEGEAVDFDGWIFGCDACQSVCPFNRHAPLHRNPKFDPKFDPTVIDWASLSEEEFSKIAGDTPLTRAGLERIKGNLQR